MLKRLRTSFFGSEKPAVSPSSVPGSVSASLPGGFQSVLSVDELLSSEHRRRYLQQIAQTCSMPSALYDMLCNRPLRALLHRVQQLPASANGPWARQGGFGDLTLQYTACAVRLAKGSMFPPGVAPEEQSAQSSAWNAVVFWSALFHHLPLLARFEGEQLNGVAWMPGMTVPEKAYRCRFRENEPSGAEASAQAALLAAQLLPSEAVSWLSSIPAALRNLTGALWNGHPEMPLIREILKQAAEKVEAPSMAAGQVASPVAAIPSAVPPAMPVAAGPHETPDSSAAVVPAADILLSELASTISMGAELPPPDAETAVTEDSTEISPSADETAGSSDETDMLLSLFSMVSAEDAQTPCDTEVPEHFAESADEPSVATAADSVPSDDDQPTGEEGDICGEDEQQATTLLSVNAEITDAGSQQLQTEDAMPDVTPVVPGTVDVSGREKSLPEGEAFLAWLKSGLRSGQLPVNGLQDKVHIVAGHVFLPVPGIFFEYMKHTGKEVIEREQIQREFEQLNICKRKNNKRYWFAHQLQDEQGENGFKRKKGYLVKGRQLFGRVPQDSPYLSFP